MISVSIRRKTLVANHACEAGLALFDAIAAQQPESDPRRLPFRLLAGSHKDWAWRGARVDLYGWHDLKGRAVQPWGTSHSSTYVDYSQGLRLVRRIT